MMLSLAPLLLALAAISGDKPDLVVLESGKEIECRVMFEDDARVLYNARGSKVVEVPRSEVAQVISIESQMRTFLSRFAAIERDDVAAYAELALWAESVDLAGEARNLWIRILLLDNENEQAWTKLGGSKGRKGWRIRVRGRYKTLEELRERASEWKTAMELPTAHYLVKTNIDPMLALDAAIDIERIHQMFYDTIGQPMVLYPFIETPELHVFADTEDAPRPPQPQWTSWYERVGNIVMVRGLEADRHEIRRAVVLMLLQNSFRWALGNRNGLLPQWTREGLANAFAFALRRPNPGEVELAKGVPHVEWFAQQASWSEALPLKRLLDAARGDFRTGSNEERFVVQSYTFVFFLVNAHEAKYREKFVEFMKTAFDEGKGASKQFEKIFGVKLEELQPEYEAYVKRIAGK